MSQYSSYTPGHRPLMAKMYREGPGRTDNMNTLALSM